MEQKKILWIVAAVSVFILVIFGFALVMNSPSKTAEQGRQFASAYTPGTATSIGRENITSKDGAANVDPDSWIQNPEQTPGLDTEIVPAGTNSLTDLNTAGNNNSIPGNTSNPDTIDVRNLTGRNETSRETAANTASAEKTTRPAATAQSEKDTTVKTAAAVTSTGSKTAVSAEAKKQTTASVKPAEPATVIQYWIQTGSFSSKLNAENARKLLTDRYLNAEIFTREANGAQTYRVRVGPYEDKKEAEYWLGTITQMPEFSKSYISQVRAKR